MRTCEPLTGVYQNEAWPDGVVAQYGGDDGKERVEDVLIGVSEDDQDLVGFVRERLDRVQQSNDADVDLDAVAREIVATCSAGVHDRVADVADGRDAVARLRACRVMLDAAHARLDELGAPRDDDRDLPTAQSVSERIGWVVENLNGPQAVVAWLREYADETPRVSAFVAAVAEQLAVEIEREFSVDRIIGVSRPGPLSDHAVRVALRSVGVPVGDDFARTLAYEVGATRSRARKEHPLAHAVMDVVGGKHISLNEGELRRVLAEQGWVEIGAPARGPRWASRQAMVTIERRETGDYVVTRAGEQVMSEVMIANVGRFPASRVEAVNAALAEAITTHRDGMALLYHEWRGEIVTSLVTMTRAHGVAALLDHLGMGDLGDKINDEVVRTATIPSVGWFKSKYLEWMAINGGHDAYGFGDWLDQQIAADATGPKIISRGEVVSMPEALLREGSFIARCSMLGGRPMMTVLGPNRAKAHTFLRRALDDGVGVSLVVNPGPLTETGAVEEQYVTAAGNTIRREPTSIERELARTIWETFGIVPPVRDPYDVVRGVEPDLDLFALQLSNILVNVCDYTPGEQTVSALQEVGALCGTPMLAGDGIRAFVAVLKRYLRDHDSITDEVVDELTKKALKGETR